MANALRRAALERRERAYRHDLEKAVQERTAELPEANGQLILRSHKIRNRRPQDFVESLLLTIDRGLSNSRRSLSVKIKKLHFTTSN